jgi:phosphoribosyl 1,2-cyclic phosphate phosphodiesterase
LKITFLGTGTSQGVPVIGCTCNTCTSSDVRDKRLRSSVLISIDNHNILIDAGPDFRQQMLTNHVSHLDAILITHEHNDHVIGMDDIRPFNFRQRVDMPIFSLERVIDEIRMKFSYIFDNKPYPGVPRVVCNTILPAETFEMFSSIKVDAIDILHGNLPILGYRIKKFAYITDASYISDQSLQGLLGLDVLVLNALQYRKHYSHFNFDEAVYMAQKIGAEKTYFTHMSHEIGLYGDMITKLPENILPAYDGLTLEL